MATQRRWLPITALLLLALALAPRPVSAQAQDPNDDDPTGAKKAQVLYPDKTNLVFQYMDTINFTYVSSFRKPHITLWCNEKNEDDKIGAAYSEFLRSFSVAYIPHPFSENHTAVTTSH